MPKGKEAWNKSILLANLLSYKKRNPKKKPIDFLRAYGKKAYPVLDKMTEAETTRFFKAEPISSKRRAPMARQRPQPWSVQGAEAAAMGERAAKKAAAMADATARDATGEAAVMGRAPMARQRPYARGVEQAPPLRMYEPGPLARPPIGPIAGDYGAPAEGVESPTVSAGDFGPGTSGREDPPGDLATKTAVLSPKGSAPGGEEFQDPAGGQFDPFAEENARQAQLGAMAASMPDTMTLGSGSRTTSTTSGPKPNVEYQKERDRKALEMRSFIEQNLATQQQLKEERDNKIKMSETKFANLEAENASEAAVVKSHLMDAQAARDDAMKEYQGKQEGFDPGRFWRNRSGFDRAVFVIGAALGGAAESLSGGKTKSNIIDMVNKLIDRDINSQIAEIKMAKGKYELKNNKVDYYTKRLGSVKAAMIQDRRDKISDIRQYISMHAQNAKTVQEKLRARELGLRYEIEGIDLKQKQFQEAQGRTVETKTAGWRKVPNAAKSAMIKAAGGGGGEKLPPHVSKSLVEMQTAVSVQGDIFNRIKRMKGVSLTTPIKKLFPWTETKFTQAQQSALAITISSAANGGRPSDKDTQYVMGLIVGPYDTVASARRKHKSLQKWFIGKTKAMVGVYGSQGYTTVPIRMTYRALGIGTEKKPPQGSKAQQ